MSITQHGQSGGGNHGIIPNGDGVTASVHGLAATTIPDGGLVAGVPTYAWPLRA